MIFTPAPKAEVAAHSESASWNQRSSLAIHSLQSWYDEQTGLYKTTGWWNSANAMTTLADYSRVTGSREFDSVFRNTLSAAQKTAPGFINRFYDDEGWWALAWIDEYDVTHDQQYLTMAESIFTDMSGGWSDTCSGGIWWSKDRKYKNAIANELFLSVAAELAVRAKSTQSRTQYLSWAHREWQWFSHSGMINADHLINDGLDANCANNHQTPWTYNQGVIIGGLTELYKADHDSALLSEAHIIATATLASPTLIDKHGILHEPCEPNCGGDGSQFKGIFVRNLLSLDEVERRPRYENFINTNANSIWAGTQPPDYHLGLIWAAPSGVVNASTQSSALDVLVAAMAISKHSKQGFTL
ncbi:MAG TPA: glycoside hydrolase family 76 protein [Granulicella sp.]